MRLSAKGSSVGSSGGSGRAHKALFGLVFACVLALVPVAQASATLVHVTMEGSGTGTVTSEPAGIDCSNAAGTSHTTCSFDFPFLTEVKYKAAPDGPFIFSGWSGTAGGTCADLVNPCAGAPLFVAEPTATAGFVPAPDPPGVATGPATAVANHSAALAGRVNPMNFAVGSCQFEYGTTTAYGQVAPCSPTSLGSGSTDVAVTGNLQVLNAQTNYHYRLVAANPGGMTQGADRTFTTEAPAPDSCPNASLRAQQGGAGELLPDCRAIEMVSPPLKSGGVVSPGSLVLSDEGARVAFTSLWIPGAESEAGGSATNPFIAQRTADGWATTPAVPPPAYSLAGSGNGNDDYASNLSGAFWYAATQEQQGSKTGGFYLQGLDGSFTSHSPLFAPLGSQGGRVTYRGVSDDLSDVVFTWEGGAGARILPTDPVTGGGNAEFTLWEVTGANTANPRILTVNRDVPGSPADGGTCGASLGGASYLGTRKHAISADGSTIYFSTYPGCEQGVGLRVYARIDGTNTVEVSASQCQRVAPEPACADATGGDQYEGASKDGERVFFSTARQLVDGDTDSTRDLYEYESSPPAGQPDLVQISAGDSAGATPAELQGVMAISTDGSRAYFVAHGIVTTATNAEGQSATEGGNNLYVYERDAAHPGGRIAFVATMAPSEVDPDRPGLPWSSPEGFAGVGVETAPTQGADPDGHFLLFPSYAQLVPQDTDTAEDMYRYDDDTGELVGVTTAGNGPVDVKWTVVGNSDKSSPVEAETGRFMSEEGQTIVFATKESLSPDDTNSVSDVYGWRDGTVSLLSIGTGASGAVTPVVSASGDDVAFVTVAQLLPQDTDGSTDAYDVRVDGGYPPPPPPPTPCSGERCQTGSGAPPGASPATTKSGGPGNPKPVSVAKPKISKVKTVHGTSTRIKVKVAEKGRIQVSGGSLKPSSARAPKKGTYAVDVRLSSGARHTLEVKHQLRVRVTVQFTVPSGQASSAQVYVTFKSEQTATGKGHSPAHSDASGKDGR